MIGLGSLGAVLAFWLSIAAAGLCVVYGILKWHTDGPPDTGKYED